MRRAIARAAVALLFGWVIPAHADDGAAPGLTPGGFFERTLAAIHARVDAAIVAKPPKLVPPQKVALSWKVAKLGSIDLGAPLLALTGGDVDGDGKGELYAVTTREIIVVGIVDKKPKELGRVAFGGERSVISPRDAVGTIVVDGASVIASVSTWQASVRASWQGGALVGAAGAPGFVQCRGEVAYLTPGRNYFGDGGTATYATRCAERVIDNDGYPLRMRAKLSVANKLDVAIERCAATDLGCQPAGRHEYAGVGIAFELGDVDRDGKPELLFAAAGAPGDPDVLKIVTLGDDDKKAAKLKKAFATGVAGLAVTDLDGNGVVDAVAAVRVAGATKVELWRLD